MDRRFFCPDIPGISETVSLPNDESHHFRTVLRGREGETVMLLNGKGVLATGEVIDVGGRRGPVVCCVLTRDVAQPSAVKIRLLVAPPRGKGMAGIVRSATELGVSRITPILTSRTTSKPEKVALANWQAAAVTAMKQAINPYCPKIDTPVALMEVLEEGVAPGVVGWIPGSAQVNAPAVLHPGEVSLFIGPEGGFTNDELTVITAKGIEPVSFGPYVLRVETAVVAGLSWLNQMIKPLDA